MSRPQPKPHAWMFANPRATALSETIYAANGRCWWSWAERISPTSDATSAARKVAAVLHSEALL